LQFALHSSEYAFWAYSSQAEFQYHAFTLKLAAQDLSHISNLLENMLKVPTIDCPDRC